MFALHADKNQLVMKEKDIITSGSAGIYEIQLEFSSEWAGLTRTAVFKAGAEKRSILLDETNGCVIPWEVMAHPNVHLFVGVYGTDGSEVVLPTVWCDLGVILTGVNPGSGARPPSPDLWERALGRKGGKLDYTSDGELGLYSGDRLLSSVPAPGCGEGGALDHRRLTGRDAEGQHSISSISGLAEKLKRIPEPVEPLTNEELEELLK